MPEAYLELAASDQKDILQTAAVRLGRKASVLEKDIWVCWALQALFSLPDIHPMAFKGGTSLSKVYGIIDRFSEDVDITLDYKHFDDTGYKDRPEEFDPFAAGVSKNQISKFCERLKGYTKAYAINTVIPHFEAELAKLPTADQHGVEVDETGEKIWIRFPSVVEASDEYLKSQLLIELGGRNVTDPNEVHTITPYVSEVTRDVTYPACDAVVLSPERTFWEKATLIHVECNRGEIKPKAERLSRHWYDLVMLARHASGKAAVGNRELFEDVIRHKKVFFNTGYAKYGDCLAGSLKLLPAGDTVNALQADYEQMLNAGMMYQDPPEFAEILEAVQRIETEINVAMRG